MIFASKSEDGIEAWRQVLDGTKVVTRRSKPQEVGRVLDVRRTRTSRSVGSIRVLSCIPSSDYVPVDGYEAEAHREGFASWDGLVGWLAEHGIDIEATYRVEFVLVGTPVR